MNRLRSLPGPVARIALLALLLAAQGLAFAHDLEHLGGHGESLCAVCSASHAQDGATLESADAAEPQPIRTPCPATATLAVRATFAGVFHARAPPASL